MARRRSVAPSINHTHGLHIHHTTRINPHTAFPYLDSIVYHLGLTPHTRRPPLDRCRGVFIFLFSCP